MSATMRTVRVGEVITNRNGPDLLCKCTIGHRLESAGFTTENVPSIAYRRAVEDGQTRIMVTTFGKGDRAEGVQVLKVRPKRLRGYVTHGFTQEAWEVLASELIEISDKQSAWDTGYRVLEVVETLSLEPVSVSAPDMERG